MSAAGSAFEVEATRAFAKPKLDGGVDVKPSSTAVTAR